MKKILLVFSLLILFSSASKSNIVYTDPLPDAKYVKTGTSIILGLDKTISSDFNLPNIVVTGSKSGAVTGNVTLSSDKKKILFKPHTNFQFNEEVSINVSPGKDIPKGLSYTFHTRLSEVDWKPGYSMRNEKTREHQYSSMVVLPELDVIVSNNPSPGKIFVANCYSPDPQYIIISENNGTPYYSKVISSNILDFKKQPNGNLTYIDDEKGKFYEIDRSYNVVDSFYCGNGYTTDVHELQVLPNRHALLMSYDPQIVDMSAVVPGGHQAATVIGLIIQEIDENKNVIFQWRSWDHFEITDATHQNFTAATIDYVHGNSIEQDSDGNLIISSRHMDEITKINRTTGAIIWRLGGKHNQFTFINDTLRFSHQHAARRIANGNITLFDNGNFHPVPSSRAIEYKLNEKDKTAELVWQYKNSPFIYGPAMGNVQRLENGNTLISWGFTAVTLTEVTPSGEIALEMKMPPGYITYRAFKFEWEDILTGTGNHESIPGAFTLYQNYPNPFNPSTTIKFYLPNSSHVKLSVFDGLGREVAVLVNSAKQMGIYEAAWDASEFPSGVYYYKIAFGVSTDIKKMLLVK